MKDTDDTIMLLLEIDPEKKVFYISDYDGNYENGIARKYKNKKEIFGILKKYLLNNVNLYPTQTVKRVYNGRKR